MYSLLWVLLYVIHIKIILDNRYSKKDAFTVKPKQLTVLCIGAPKTVELEDDNAILLYILTLFS